MLKLRKRQNKKRIKSDLRIIGRENINLKLNKTYFYKGNRGAKS